MGTRTNAYLLNDLPRIDDVADIIARLTVASPEALAVGNYWRSVNTDPDPWEETNWMAEPPNPRMPNKRRYVGPGSLHITIGPQAARITSGARWRGFLTIEPLQRVHLQAFRAIAIAMKSATLAICADSDDVVIDAFIADGSQSDCIAALRSRMGPPQPSAENIAIEIVARCEHGVPSVWFLDHLPPAPECELAIE